MKKKKEFRMLSKLWYSWELAHSNQPKTENCWPCDSTHHGFVKRRQGRGVGSSSPWDIFFCDTWPLFDRYYHLYHLLSPRENTMKGMKCERNEKDKNGWIVEEARLPDMRGRGPNPGLWFSSRNLKISILCLPDISTVFSYTYSMSAAHVA